MGSRPASYRLSRADFIAIYSNLRRKFHEIAMNREPASQRRCRGRMPEYLATE
jgi:hypothetical protein